MIQGGRPRKPAAGDNFAYALGEGGRMVEHESSGGSVSVIGRVTELAFLENALAGGAPGRAVVMIGSPGIGKSTLWDASVGHARADGMRVLAARPSSSEARLPFAGLIDLCDDIGPADLAGLPGRQRSVLESALLRSDPPGGPVERTAIAFALRDAVRSVAARDPVLIAIDDLQWLDRPSAELLAFTARRLGNAQVRFLVSRRPGRTGALEQALATQGLEHLRIEGLSLGAARRLLFERLGLTLSRPLLRRIVEVTEGNPLYALELGRSFVEEGTPTAADAIPLPDTVEELLGVRVARLSRPVRRVLLAIALSADPRVGRVAAVCEAGAIDDAIDAGVVEIDGDRLRASHPLLAVSAERHARARERRELHLALAGVAGEEQLRVLHSVLATTGPDEAVAAAAMAAAEDACARGARRQAVVLASHALRLTPAGAPARPERVLSLAEYLDAAGELRRLTALLEEETPSLPAGGMRARAWLMLSEGASVSGLEDQTRFLERALAECGDDQNLRAHLLAKMAGHVAAATVSQLAKAEEMALDAVQDATEARVERFALYSLAWARTLAGRSVDDLCERSRVADDPAAYVSASPERVAAKRLMWRGEVARARTLFGSLSALADERSDPTSYAMVRLHLCELDLRAGELDSASQRLDEWSESSDYETQFRPQYQRCQGLLAAGRGDAEQARHWAGQTLERAASAGSRWDEFEALRARGIAALLERALEQAVEDLQRVWQHCEQEGVREPGAFPVAPELVEALVELAQTDTAQAVTERLGQLAEQQEHPWATATEKRCRAVVMLAVDPHDEVAAELLHEAADDLERLELRLDAARCRLCLGRTQRRAKRWRAAREALQAAVAEFTALQADGWADRASAELARVGARRPRGGPAELTPSERRVVDLAVEGLSNKQIAQTLYVSVNTVEVHLTHAYAKLQVHSRAQLAAVLATRT